MSRKPFTRREFCTAFGFVALGTALFGHAATADEASIAKLVEGGPYPDMIGDRGLIGKNDDGGGVHIVFHLQRQLGGPAHHQVNLDPAMGAQHLHQADPIDGAGGAGDGDNQAIHAHIPHDSNMLYYNVLGGFVDYCS